MGNNGNKDELKDCQTEFAQFGIPPIYFCQFRKREKLSFILELIPENDDNEGDEENKSEENNDLNIFVQV